MNKQNIRDFILYGIVGAIATVTEWAIFFLMDICSWHYILATAVAYTISTFVNWLAGRALVFKVSNKPFLKEIADIYLVSIVGLLLNLLIMWISVDLLSANEMLSKVMATALVFFYNFIMRKVFVYK